MRKMIAVAAVLAVTSAQAEELKFGDLNYFLEAGQVNVAADLSSVYNKETIDSDIFETRGLLTEATLGYALSDKLNAFVGIGYAYDFETEEQTSAPTVDYSSDSFTTPALGLNYRVMNQNESRYNFDVGAVVKYGLEDAKRGSSELKESKDGNVVNERNSLELNARMGRKWNEANEWQLAAGVVYNNDGEYELRTPNGNADIEVDSSLDYFVRASYQYRPVNEFMMLLSAQANYISDIESEVDGTDTTFEDEQRIDYDFRFTAKYLITDNFIAKFNYGMSRNENYNRDFNDGDSQKYKQRRENFFGLGAEFLF